MINVVKKSAYFKILRQILEKRVFSLELQSSEFERFFPAIRDELQENSEHE